MKIIVKLTLAFLSIVFLVLVVGYVVTHATEQALRKSIGRSSVIFAQETINHVDTLIHARLEQLQSYSRDPLLLGALKASNIEYEQYESRQKRQSDIEEIDRAWRSGENVAFIDNFNERFLSQQLRNELEAKEFYWQKYGHTVFEEVFVTNKFGVNVAQTQKTTDFFQADEIWWQQAKANGIYVGDVVFDKSSGVFALEMALKIEGLDGEFLGVLKAILNIQEVIEIIKTEEKFRKQRGFFSRKFILLDGKGRMLYSTAGYKQFDLFTSSLYIFSEQKEKHRDFWISKAADGMEKDAKFIAHAHSFGFKDYPGLGWILLLEFDAKEILNPVYDLRRRLLLVLLIVAVLAVLIGIVISRNISLPIERLQKATTEVAKGNLDVNIDTKRDDEIGQLASSFRNMTLALRQSTTSIDSLNRQIDERHKVEQALKKANEDLAKNEKALKNMLYDLKQSHDELVATQRQLVQSEKLASIGQLSAGIAHEINNPIGFINSNLSTLNKYIENLSEILRAQELLKDAVGAKDLNRALKIEKQMQELEEKLDIKYILNDIDNLLRESKEGVDRVKKIVLDLKTFSRADKEERAPEDINKIIEGVINIVWNEIKYKAELKKEFGQLPLVACSAQQLGQVFINMLVNASHAIKDKGVIVVKTFAKEDKAYVQITDNGEGMDEETKNKIFDPFFTTKDVGKGTGLGLSISYEVIKKHNGEIEIDSSPGKGTTFTVILPTEES